MKKIKIALAGNANVGKSVIFNHLTGLHQHTGNWPGKTVEKAEGTLHFEGYTIDVIDLPGIYSLSTFSIEELITRKYIATGEADIVINVVDASVLERNLFFTLQLMELETPMIVALNQIDLAKAKGIEIDVKTLSQILGLPVVPTVGVKGIGIYALIENTIKAYEKKINPHPVTYGEEVENRIIKILENIENLSLSYPLRYASIQLLQGDEEIEKEVKTIDPDLYFKAKTLSKELEDIHGHPCSTIITSERYEKAGKIAREVQKVIPPLKPHLSDVLHNITTNRVLGYPIMLGILISIFLTIFTFGDASSSLLSQFFEGLDPVFKRILGTGIIGKLIQEGIIEGVISGLSVALPYLTPFYIVLYLLEDSGYLSRIAFLMDNLMHKIGLHGKAFIPILLSYGCNVPGCLGCRIMETKRERLIAAFVTTLVPCAATSVIILGLVGKFIGIQWALALYLFNLVVIFVLGRAAFKTLPEEPVSLIMEMSDYRVPHLKTVLTQSWFRLEEFIKIAFPYIILGSFTVKVFEIFSLLDPIQSLFSPVTVTWLGLPSIAGLALIFGVLRKELTLIMLSTFLGTTNFAQALTPLQMIVFTVVAMFYIPCISTIAALIKEFGVKKAFYISVFETVFAIILGGITFRVLPLFGIN